MAKRRQRITPKLPKRPRKDTNLSSHSSSASSDSGGVNRAESSSSSKADKKSASRHSGSSTKRASTKTRKDTSKTVKRQNTTSQRIRDLTVSKAAFSKWKPLNSSTKKYIKKIIANTQLKLLGHGAIDAQEKIKKTINKHKNGTRNIVSEVTHDAKKDQVHQCLGNLQKRIMIKIDCLKGPDNKYNYTQLEQESKSVEVSLSAINSQLLTLETELEAQKQLLKDEEEIEQKQVNSFNQNTQGIQDFIPGSSLNLTNLSQESLERPIPKIPSDLNKAAQRLSSVLSKKKEELEQMGFYQWMDTLSQLQSQINSL